MKVFQALIDYSQREDEAHDSGKERPYLTRLLYWLC